jgi:hypothetical protein
METPTNWVRDAFDPDRPPTAPLSPWVREFVDTVLDINPTPAGPAGPAWLVDLLNSLNHGEK